MRNTMANVQCMGHCIPFGNLSALANPTVLWKTAPFLNSPMKSASAHPASLASDMACAPGNEFLQAPG